MLVLEDLLLGGAQTHVVDVPADVLHPAGDDPPDGAAGPATVVIRPLTLADVQRIHKAAQESSTLTSILMVSQALVEPRAGVEDVSRMHAGAVEFLLGHVNRVSGLTLAGDELDEAVRAPLARACFVLAREFGWTPDECAGLTLGQILLYIEMVGRGDRSCSAAS